MLGIAVFRIRLYLAGKSVCAFDHGHECSLSLSAAPCAATPETCTAPPIECTVVAIDLVHFGAQPSIRKRARSGRLLTGRTVQRSVKIYSAPGDATPAGYAPLFGPLWTDAVASFEHGGLLAGSPFVAAWRLDLLPACCSAIPALILAAQGPPCVAGLVGSRRVRSEYRKQDFSGQQSSISSGCVSY